VGEDIANPVAHVYCTVSPTLHWHLDRQLPQLANPFLTSNTRQRGSEINKF